MNIKTLIFLMIFSLKSLSIFCQTQSPTTDKEWSDLVVFLSNEDFSEANQLVTLMLKKTLKADIEGEPAILRYMHIICVSALMNAGTYSKEEALLKVKEYEGQNIITASKSIIGQNCNFNCLKIDDEEKNTIFTTSTNSQGTVIFGFERYQISDGITPQYLEQNTGKKGIIGGVLESITVEGNILPRFKLKVIDARLIIE